MPLFLSQGFKGVTNNDNADEIWLRGKFVS